MLHRISCEWSDGEAVYYYCLQYHDHCAREEWITESGCSTFDREKAQRWAAHYEIKLPDEPDK